MRRIVLLTLAAAVSLAVAGAIGAATRTVQITKNGFTPATFTIAAGDTVTWRNADTKNHQVVADNGSFASPVLAPNASWSWTATRSGTYRYRDSFATSKRGTITVTAPPASLTLGAALPTVIYGSATQLNGQISTQLASQPVTLSAQPYGKSVQSVQSTTTQSNGVFIFGVTPTITTTYTARYTTSTSNPVTVNVAPRVGFGRSGSIFIAKVTSDLGYSGKYVIVQKKNKNGTWYAFKRVYLGDANRATFKIPMKGSYTFRLYLPGSQAGVGYVQGFSRLLPTTLR